MRTAAVLLAAGDGTRFEGPVPKLLCDFRGRPLWRWAFDAAAGAGCDLLLVVTGAVPLTVPDAAVEVTNPRWAQGQSTSVQAGVAAAAERGCDAVVVGLADAPLIGAEAWAAVANSGADLAVATFDGVRHPPVRLGRLVWPDLPVTGDAGARGLLRERGAAVVEVPCPGRAVDIDTMEDLARWS